MRTRASLAIASVGLALLATPLSPVTPASAQSQPAAKTVTVEHAWSRAALAGRTGVAYLTIVPGAAADSLTAATSPVAAGAELHETVKQGNVMEMRPVTALPVPPGRPVVLKPGGYHIMLMGLKQPLNPGDTFPLTLTFAHAGTRTVTVTVGIAGGMGPPGMESMGNTPMGHTPGTSGGAMHH